MTKRTFPLLVLLAISASAQPAPETGRIVGVVTDAETGEPLPGASVWLIGTQMGASANVDGQFVIDDVPVGDYEAQASFVGAELQTASMRVRAGETVGFWPKLEFVMLCECVIVMTLPESISRGVYQARVVEHLGTETSCCTWSVERRASPLAHWETR